MSYVVKCLLKSAHGISADLRWVLFCSLTSHLCHLTHRICWLISWLAYEKMNDLRMTDKKTQILELIKLNINWADADILQHAIAPHISILHSSSSIEFGMTGFHDLSWLLWVIKTPTYPIVFVFHTAVIWEEMIIGKFLQDIPKRHATKGR